MMVGYLMIAFLRDLPSRAITGAFFGGIMTWRRAPPSSNPASRDRSPQNLTKANSSVGWGIFYWVVNVGAFVGHYLPSIHARAEHVSSRARSTPKANSAGSVAQPVRRLGDLLLLQPPPPVRLPRTSPPGASKTESMLGVLAHDPRQHPRRVRLIAWLAIMSCFWMMMYQLWDLQPNFIADWVDSRPMAEMLGWAAGFPGAEGPDRADAPRSDDPAAGAAQREFALHHPRRRGRAWLTRKMRTLRPC
jgi:hypothetical protein